MLRSKIIRLAHMNPELRPHLLPLLRKEAAGRVPLDKDIMQMYPKGRKEKWYHTPAFSQLKIDRMEGTEVTFMDLEPRFTNHGPRPFVMHVLVEDADGNTAWIAPWNMSRSGTSPKFREDIEVIARKLNTPLKKLGLKRYTGGIRYRRSWALPYQQSIKDPEPVKRALDKLSWLRKVKDGVYEVEWPIGKGRTATYTVVVGGGEVYLKPKGTI